ncbi:MAG: S41 family peptidase [Pirellulales bacterium]|nr:S41 family peptidase [Pirellulales bacterium]
MRRWVMRKLSHLVVLAAVVGAGSAWAQISFSPSAGTAQEEIGPQSSVSDELAGVLTRGQALEAQRRWGEALTLYEEALRSYPHDRDLAERMQVSRIHYDLGRRYHDRTFLQSLKELTPEAALDLYSEVLLKIHAHYVDAPAWTSLVQHGTRALEIALEDPLFLESHLSDVVPARIHRFRRDLRSHAADLQPTSRQAARECVSRLARLAYDSLGLPETVTVLEYACGAAGALDAYSTFLTAGQLDEVYAQIEGNFVGLGIELKAAEGALQIVKVIPGSPAQRARLQAGDRIVAVDGRSTREMSADEAANLLQGPEGTLVEILVASPGRAARAVQIRREEVEVPSIDEARIIDRAHGVAYLRLTCFQKTTTRDLDAALWKLHRAGMRSLIIDLRGNPGGLLTTSVEVADKFVSQGVIVSTRGRNRQEDFSYSAHASGTWRTPLVVLIDGESASASEIFAGAIRDHRRGTIVGSRSYGKGSVQGIFPLNASNAGLRLTTARFYSPHGHPYNEVGVQPDVEVQVVARPDAAGNVPRVGDPALEAAIREARRLAPPRTGVARSP